VCKYLAAYIVDRPDPGHAIRWPGSLTFVVESPLANRGDVVAQVRPPARRSPPPCQVEPPRERSRPRGQAGDLHRARPAGDAKADHEDGEMREEIACNRALCFREEHLHALNIPLLGAGAGRLTRRWRVLRDHSIALPISDPDDAP
jgi:hypothetical protein